jgi:hypothetical protein
MQAGTDESAIPAAGGASRRPNPEAIAWYVEEAQRLLEDQQQRAESLRTRGGQIAGFGAAVLALIGGNATVLLSALSGFPGTFIDATLVAAACCLAAAVSIAIWGTLRPKAFAAISAEEIDNYITPAFLSEVDLWRVHVRSLHMLRDAASISQQGGDAAAGAIEWSLYAFSAGLSFSFLAVATLIIGSI